MCPSKKGITLFTLLWKFYSRVHLLDEPQIENGPFGVHFGCETMNQVYTLTRVQEETWESAEPVCMYFVQQQKVCHHVPQGVLRLVLQKYGVNG